MTTAKYELKGATLYFRTAATADRRAGKMVTLKISKRPSGPSVKLDTSKLCITGLKIGETQYRVGGSDTWITFTSTDTKAKSIDLKTILAVSSSAITAIPAGTVEFRTLGTNKKLNSSVKVIDISLQPTVPTQISVIGSTLSITDPTPKRYYEYTVVPQGKTLDFNTAKWTSVTAKNSIKIKKVSVGDLVYVRLKSTTDPTSKQPVLASTCTTPFTITYISQ
jgi:hypothetical protein